MDTFKAHSEPKRRVFFEAYLVSCELGDGEKEGHDHRHDHPVIKVSVRKHDDDKLTTLYLRTWSVEQALFLKEEGRAKAGPQSMGRTQRVYIEAVELENGELWAANIAIHGTMVRCTVPAIQRP